MAKEMKTLESVAKDLNIPYSKYDQDWGIEYADANRVAAFIDYANENMPISNNTALFYLFELIVASFNEALLEQKAAGIEEKFMTFIHKHKHKTLFHTIFTYWIRIRDLEEFPVGYYLRRARQKKQKANHLSLANSDSSVSMLSSSFFMWFL